MRAELQRLRDFRAREHRADRKAGAERLGERQDVGARIVPLPGPELAAAAHAALDLVEHEQCVVPVAQRAQAGEITRGRRQHAAFALYRLHQHRGDIAVRHCHFHRGEVVVRAIAEAAGQRLEAFLVFRLRRRRDGGERAAVERALEREDHAAVRAASLRGGPAARELDRCFIRLGAGIAQVYALGKTGGFDEFFGELERRFADEDVARVPELARLRSQRLDEFGIGVAERAHRDAGGEIHVLASFAVPHARAESALDHDAARTIHRHVVAIGVGEQGLRGGRSVHDGSIGRCGCSIMR